MVQPHKEVVYMYSLAKVVVMHNIINKKTALSRDPDLRQLPLNLESGCRILILFSITTKR